MSNNLLLLHGALGSQTQFLPLKKLLVSDFEVRVFSFSGHGNNVSDKEFSMQLFVEDVLNFMHLHALESTSIFGHSMGGYVGLKLAVDYPEKVDKLMTLGTKIKWDPEIAQKEISMLDPLKMAAKIPHLTKILKERHQSNGWKNVVTKTAKMMNRLGNGKALTKEEFEKIKTPVLVGRGAGDKMITEEESRGLVQQLENGSFVEIEGAKHSITDTNKEKLTQVIINFMK